MSEKCIHFLPSGKRIVFTNESSVLDVALRNEIEISHSCGGMGSCTTCRVIVLKAPQGLPERGEMEADVAEMRGFRPEERLSCQLPPSAGLSVLIPETLDSDLART